MTTLYLDVSNAEPLLLAHWKAAFTSFWAEPRALSKVWRGQSEGDAAVRCVTLPDALLPPHYSLGSNLVDSCVCRSFGWFLLGVLFLNVLQNEESHPKVACSLKLVAGVGFEPTTFRL